MDELNVRGRNADSNEGVIMIQPRQFLQGLERRCASLIREIDNRNLFGLPRSTRNVDLIGEAECVQRAGDRCRAGDRKTVRPVLTAEFFAVVRDAATKLANWLYRS